MDPGQADGEYMGVTLIEPGAAAGLADALEATWRRDPGRYYEDGFAEFVGRGGEVLAAPVGAIEWVEVDDHADLRRARQIAAYVSEGHAAARSNARRPHGERNQARADRRLGSLLAEHNVAPTGDWPWWSAPAGADIIAPSLRVDAEVFTTAASGALELGAALRAGDFAAVAGVGGGKTIDVTKFAALHAGLPMVSVATSLSHDGIASPVSTLEHPAGRGSYGVMPPVAVVVDLDRVRAAPGHLATAGIRRGEQPVGDRRLGAVSG
jgi:hypothetical protein